LIAAGLLRKIEAPDNGTTGGAFWYELAKTPEIVSCVPCAVLDFPLRELPRARYATETFTLCKTEDAYQRGGTKRQRAAATIPAIGDGLLVIDILQDYGPLSHQQIGAISKQSKSTISRIIRRLEAFGPVTVEKQWRERIVTLSADWQATVKRLTPAMPTYGNKFRRELSAHLRTVEYCDRQTARGIGDKQRIEKQRACAAKAAFDLQAQELAEHFTTERQTETLRRLQQHDTQHRAASGVKKTVRTVPLVEVMARKPVAKWFEPYTQEDNRRLVEIMQTLEDNATLADAREQMRAEASGCLVPPASVDYQQFGLGLAPSRN
jgi:DNA-binding MarR family transcriptional regulator